VPDAPQRRRPGRRSTRLGDATAGADVDSELSDAAADGPGRPRGQSPSWVPALMVACFLLGLVWLVVYYLAGQQVPGMSGLGNWNLLIGIGLISIGFVVSTQWR